MLLPMRGTERVRFPVPCSRYDVHHRMNRDGLGIRNMGWKNGVGPFGERGIMRPCPLWDRGLPLWIGSIRFFLYAHRIMALPFIIHAPGYPVQRNTQQAHGRPGNIATKGAGPKLFGAEGFFAPIWGSSNFRTKILKKRHPALDKKGGCLLSLRAVQRYTIIIFRPKGKLAARFKKF